MPDFVRHEPAPEDQLPESVKTLGPNCVFLFSVLSRRAAAHCLRLRTLLPYSGLVVDPDYRPLGDPTMQAKRLSTPTPGDRQGMLAERVSLTYTPRNAVVYGSCGPTPKSGAHPFTADDLVIAALSLPRLLGSGMSAIYCDRLPLRNDVEATAVPQLDRIPWDRIRDSRFGPPVTPNELMRYNAEVLIRGPLPVTMLTWAVPTQGAAEALSAQAQAYGIKDLTVVVREKLFF